MGIDAGVFKVLEGTQIDLAAWSTTSKSLCKSKKAYSKLLQDHVEKLSDQQRMLYASNRYALLLVF